MSESAEGGSAFEFVGPVAGLVGGGVEQVGGLVFEVLEDTAGFLLYIAELVSGCVFDVSDFVGCCVFDVGSFLFKGLYAFCGGYFGFGNRSGGGRLCS